MITKEEFVKIITNYNKFQKGIDRIFKAFTGEEYYYYECDWVETVNLMFETTIYTHFTEAGADWIFYYMYETIEDKKVLITIEADLFNGQRKMEYHLNSIEDLWNFLMTNKKIYFKDAE